MNNTIKIAVLIPIKDHSERIKQKNFRLIGKAPLHSIIIKKMMQIDQIDKIYINTDSSRIKKYYKNNPKVQIIDREKRVIGDFISMNDIISSSLKHIKEDVIIQTHVTNPLLRKETIIDAIKKYFMEIEQGFDSLFSVNKYYKRFFDKNFKPINHDLNVLLRTQDLEPVFVENSCLYIFNEESFYKNNNRIGDNPFFYEMDEYESIDIDWPNDLVIVKKIYKE